LLSSDLGEYDWKNVAKLPTSLSRLGGSRLSSGLAPAAIKVLTTSTWAASSVLPPTTIHPMAQLLPPSVLSSLPPAVVHAILARTFFPTVIAPAFMNGLGLAFRVGAELCLMAAIASLLRGKPYIYAHPAQAGAAAEIRT
jgi:hypothetical protein